jgi:hypothetical protein
MPAPIQGVTWTETLVDTLGSETDATVMLVLPRATPTIHPVGRAMAMAVLALTYVRASPWSVAGSVTVRLTLSPTAMLGLAGLTVIPDPGSTTVAPVSLMHAVVAARVQAARRTKRDTAEADRCMLESRHSAGPAQASHAGVDSSQRVAGPRTRTYLRRHGG